MLKIQSATQKPQLTFKKNVQIVVKQKVTSQGRYSTEEHFLNHSKVDHLLSKIIYKALRVENDR